MFDHLPSPRSLFVPINDSHTNLSLPLPLRSLAAVAEKVGETVKKVAQSFSADGGAVGSKFRADGEVGQVGEKSEFARFARFLSHRVVRFCPAVRFPFCFLHPSLPPIPLLLPVPPTSSVLLLSPPSVHSLLVPLLVPTHNNILTLMPLLSTLP